MSDSNYDRLAEGFAAAEACAEAEAYAVADAERERRYAENRPTLEALVKAVVAVLRAAEVHPQTRFEQSISLKGPKYRAKALSAWVRKQEFAEEPSGGSTWFGLRHEMRERIRGIPGDDVERAVKEAERRGLVRRERQNLAVDDGREEVEVLRLTKAAAAEQGPSTATAIKPAWSRAAEALQWAETENGDSFENDGEAYDWLKEYAECRGEIPNDYDLPPHHTTFARYLRAFRRAMGLTPANAPRRGRTGRSIVRSDEIE